MVSREIKNYIYYVSDIEVVPPRGHFFKMHKEREIAEHIARGIGCCGIIKSSEYDGSLIEADSVGIVFPTHSWGISLAVYSFVLNLAVKSGTYVYAVAAGEIIYADKTGKVNENSMESFARLFVKKKLGKRSDIYVRCGNVKRIPGSTEERIRYSYNKVENIKAIMKGLLCYGIDSICEHGVIDIGNVVNAAFDRAGLYESDSTITGYCMEELRRNTGTSDIRLGNVFLDEDMLEGVRLCQGM